MSTANGEPPVSWRKRLFDPPHKVVFAIIGLAVCVPLLWWIALHDPLDILLTVCVVVACILGGFFLLRLLFVVLAWIGLCLRFDLQALRDDRLTGGEMFWTTIRLLMVGGVFWASVSLFYNLALIAFMLESIKLVAGFLGFSYGFLPLILCQLVSTDDRLTMRIHLYPKHWHDQALERGIPLGENWADLIRKGIAQ